MSNTAKQIQVGTHGKGLRALIEALETCTPFKTAGAFQAMAGVPSGTGRMPKDERERFETDRPQITYTVLSYATPIAWVLENGETYVSDTYYSPTTTKHQSRVRVYLNRANVIDEAA
ncbi:hypothetical protein ACIBCT_35300 [Streptosporangium sp. NPDC050855]|uniref:hypothetical protein n=1 Tax=Streptosporangium sp. NPDC050855 TaxID=3366194 RepID=UPI0037A76CE9